MKNKLVSLTDFIKDPPVRDRFNDEFPNQGNRASNPIRAEWQTQNYMLIGTAFDYLLRFWLRRNISECHSQPWIAEISLEIAEEEFPESADKIRSAISRAKTARDDYLETGKVTPKLIKSAIDLARIDGIYRGGRIPTDLGEYNDNDIVDCIRLVEILDNSDELDGSVVHLNPTFGLASGFVGGADADAILDGTLIDVKTTGKPTFKADYWRQLVGYLVLADIHNILYDTGVYDQLGIGEDVEERPLPVIEEFGVYFVRHGELSTVSASAVYDADNYSEFRSWFVKTAFDKYEPYSPNLRDTFQMLF